MITFQEDRQIEENALYYTLHNLNDDDVNDTSGVEQAAWFFSPISDPDLKFQALHVHNLNDDDVKDTNGVGRAT